MTLSAATEHCPESGLLSPACLECQSGRTLSTQGLCCKDFRRALGSFPTGVTVLTTLDADGRACGMTISSFNSVSLEPPLILWSLALNSPSLEIFRNASHYAVNVLSAEQQVLSNRFASRLADRFAGVDTRSGLSGSPLLEGCSAWFECRHEAIYPGGDHLVFLGRVERFALNPGHLPLVFHAGAYARIAPRDVTPD